ncbi:pilus assembly protein [Hydrogenophaga flava]|uniref:pilus assembly protein n=1 Tax=Hydrogenophaga flava TaxID=65657 RepID=UPI000A03362D|nr:PilC/PilY family type IV pilus protein [Hydrogenophaga flava]
MPNNTLYKQYSSEVSMNFPVTTRRTRRLLWSVALGAVLLPALQAWAQPANRPLLTNQSGAKPNLMVALDNSGSMAFTYHETYNVTDSNEYQRRYCPTPYSRSSSANLATFNAGIGQEANTTLGPPVVYTCYQRVRVSGNWVTQPRTNVALAYAPDQSVLNWSAQRSAEVNPIYYNPRVRYLPRVDGSGTVVSPRDPLLPNTVPAGERGLTYNVVWVSNQNSVDFRYTLYQRNVAPNDFRIYHSMYADNAAAPPTGSTATRNSQGHVNTLAPSGFTSRYNLQYTLKIPQHIAYTSAPTAGPATTFSYSYCTNVVTNGLGQETGCTASTRVDVRLGDTATYTIPTPNTRTDCTANVCNNAQEVANILNWYRWYSTRQLATSTAIGLALADTDATGALNIPSNFDNQLRIGYLPINQRYDGPLTLPPGAGAPVTLSRGVRLLSRGSTANTEVFNWLNTMVSQGGTPLHYAVERAASYFSMGAGVTENPWRTDPTDASSPEMSCRRSFNLLFSDGGWTSGSPWGPDAAGPDYDNTQGPEFSRTLPDGSTETFRYSPTGINTPAGRAKYVPFPSTGTGSLADLTARYYWHTDMRTGLDNNIQAGNGQPTFWQNMATYTVGYLIEPSGGEAPPAPAPLPAGLTFRQINEYITQYKLNGLGGTTLPPSFPTGDLLSSGAQTRVDDFIHAGYTGGARSFSAKTADDVKSIFNTILAEILGASGRDAGVSVNTGGGDNSTLAGRLKYTVSYRTMYNTGDILARELAANGSETGVTVWSANQLMPSHTARRVFTMHGLNQPVDFNGSFSGLQSDIQSALATGPDAGRIRSDASFINYLRGDNTALDSYGMLFRQRESKIAAMVNPPAVFMGGSRDYAYDQDGSGGVDGRGSYVDYTNRKRGYPASLFVATNAGTMHAFSAEAGNELAAVMPRRSLKRMLHFADEPYTFEYVLDGPITENDIFDRRKANSDGLSEANEWRAWRHLAVGTGGRGEKLVYAVNSPIKPGVTPNRIPDREDFLWETGPDVINSADGSDVTVGYMSNAARSGQTEDLSDATNARRGRWIVAINNGHYNGEPDGEKNGLVVLDAVTGEVIRTIPLPDAHPAGDGLSGVTLLRSYGTNTRVVAAYAGDAMGQLWKFNLSGDPSTWHVEHDRPLFTVPGNRPIYGHPAWQAHEAGGFIVVFGTGIMLEEDHLDDLGQQTIYGIWDRQNLDGTMLNNETFTPVSETQLEERSVVPASATSRNGFFYYAITGDTIDWESQRGWFMRMNNVHQQDDALRAGERSIADVQNFGRSVIITSTVLRPPPEGEMCTAASLPGNYVYIVNAQSASPELSRSFDVDGDGRLDAWDSNADSRVDAGYAVAFAPMGGFTRGISVSRFRSRPDGTALPDDPQTDTGSSSDPQVTETVSDRLEKAADEAAGESALSQSGAPKCRTMRGIILGTEETPLGAGVYCPTTGWSRTQFQLSAPPRN